MVKQKTDEKNINNYLYDDLDEETLLQIDNDIASSNDEGEENQNNFIVKFCS